MRNNTYPATRSINSNEPNPDVARAFLLLNRAVPIEQFPDEERRKVERFRAALDEMKEMEHRYGGDCYISFRVPPPAYFFELLLSAEGDDDPAGTAERLHRKLMADWKMPKPVQ